MSVTDEVIPCPRCSGSGVDPIESLVCCKKPYYDQCCGDPDPEWHPCQYCEGTGKVDLINYMNDLLSGEFSG